MESVMSEMRECEGCGLPVAEIDGSLVDVTGGASQSGDVQINTDVEHECNTR